MCACLRPSLSLSYFLRVWEGPSFSVKGNFSGFYPFYVHYSTLLHLLPLRFHGVGGCWDRIQDSCDFGTDSQTL